MSRLGRQLRGLRRRRLRQHDHLGADLHAAVEIFHVFVGEADAARRHLLADGGRIVGAVDAIFGAAEIHGAGAERIARAAGHHARQIRLARDHLGRRIPVRPLGLARYLLDARPGEALAADADAVTDRLAVAEHVIKEGVRGIDDDGAGRLAAGVVDDLPLQARIELAVFSIRVLIGQRGLARLRCDLALHGWRQEGEQ